MTYPDSKIESSTGHDRPSAKTNTPTRLTTSKCNLANFKCVLCAKALKLLTWLESLCMMSQKKLVYRPRRSPLLLDIRIR